MPFSRSICSSITNNETLAFLSSDSVLHVWDVKTSEQKQQYLPSSHLTATFTCLSWKAETAKSQNKRTKSKLSKTSHVTSEFIALGTAVGEIVLYNAQNGEFVTRYTGGHSGQVNCIAWAPDGTFYSCSNDQHIVQWNMSSSSYKDKWKASKRELYCICVGPYERTLLSGGKMIKLWDLKTKTSLRVYSGHSSPIICLSYLNYPKSSSIDTENILNSLDGVYFFSAACDNRAMSAWQISSSKNKKVPACSFSLPSEPCLFDALPSPSPTEPAWLLVVVEDKQVVLFTHVLNGHNEKPLRPCKSIKVVTEEAQSLQVVCACFDKNSVDDSIRMTIAYGSSFRVVFEQINLQEYSDDEIILIRKDPSKSDIYLEGNKVKLREPGRNRNVTAIAPGVIAHAGNKSAKKRKNHSALSEGELTLEERVSASSTNLTPTKNVPRADSLAVLLSQGLQSKDRDILNQVLQHGNDAMIKNTVTQISIKYVVPLLEELAIRLKGNPEKCSIFAKWMKTTLNHHSSFLTTLPTIVPFLNDVYQLVNVRKRSQDRLTSMQGRLELMLSHIQSRESHDSAASNEQQQALFVYEEDSSDMEDMDNISEHSEQTDEWNNLETMEDLDQ